MRQLLSERFPDHSRIHHIPAETLRCCAMKNTASWLKQVIHHLRCLNNPFSFQQSLDVKALAKSCCLATFVLFCHFSTLWSLWCYFVPIWLSGHYWLIKSALNMAWFNTLFALQRSCTVLTGANSAASIFKFWCFLAFSLSSFQIFFMTFFEKKAHKFSLDSDYSCAWKILYVVILGRISPKLFYWAPYFKNKGKRNIIIY